MPQTTHLKRHIFIGYNGKIADITHADTNAHTLNLATALSETRKIVMLIMMTSRMGGSGYVVVFPNSGVTGLTLWVTLDRTVSIVINANLLTYNFTVANDDFDLYCFGYVVEV